ncbi:VOC family protein [Streptomyces sp. SL13]|jgi:predicted enzyme related to lactoylglutathione lyase|uniref:VOC family protein n=1 Tax=Streptantibioticus silvisoli TaxID=2705255 RepID=A0AA90HAH1_9ACTN|nr:VOC family protein [Streptantibioticus silvisoli]MDI5965936.1 VOC family protein [Streptantibioticus silvisoli]MDI5974311.1 VOC family protein [Streptantibioticus silvisoli]
MTEVPAQRPQGAPCWVSLLVRSLPAAQEFYGGLFGWRFQPGPTHFGPYARAVLDGRLVAGIGESPRRLGQPVAWTTYLSTADADAAAETIRVSGGTVAVGPLDADGEAGRMVIAADPSGASFGVWQPKGHTGVGVTGVPGTLAWNELVTREADVTAFYGAAFGFEADAPVPADDGSGSPAQDVTLRLGGRPVAGLHAVGAALPRARGARWTTWFEVADTDAAVERAGALGGRVLRAAHEVKRGRIAELADPQGAAFTVVRSNG